MDKHLLQQLVITITIVVSRSSFIEIGSDGGYQNVLVSLSPRVAKLERSHEEFKTNLQEFFKEVSRLLFTATRGNAFLGNISVLVPSTWPGRSGSDVINRSYETYHQSDIRIDTFNPLFKNDQLYTQQPRGCGQPGNYIYLPHNLLRNWKASPSKRSAKQFLQEWAKFKYGVFEEFGYVDNEIFPRDYENRFGNKQKTGCTPSYLWKTECTSDIPRLCTTTTNTTGASPQSSIMDDVDLNTSTFCNESVEHEHNPDAPTRHNMLCLERSTWNVVSQNEDFLKIIKPEFRDPEITFVRMTAMDVVLILDPNLCVNFRKRSYHPVRLSLIKFINDFPYGGKLAIVIADKNIDRIISWTVLTDKQSRANMRKVLDSKLKVQISDFEVDFIKAINNTVKILNDASPSRGYVMLFSSGQELDSNSTLSSVFEAMKKIIPLHFLLVTWTRNDSDIHHEPLPSNIENMNRFQKRFAWFNIPFTGSIDECNLRSVLDMQRIFNWFYNNYNVEDYYSKKIEIHSGFPAARDQFKPNRIAKFTLNFYTCQVDLSEDYKLLINAQIEANFTNAEFFKYHYLSHIWKPKPKESNANITYLFTTEDLTEPESGVLTATSVWLETDDDTSQSDLTQFTFPIGEVFSDYNPEEEQSTPHVLLYVYAPNEWGKKIYAIVQKQQSQPAHFHLLNNGNGDPDTKSDDGIYSSYVVNLTRAAGTYSVVLYADHKFRDLGLFYFPGGDVQTFPPNRITDFRRSAAIEIDENNMKTTMQWTSAGNLYNFGAVLKYSLKCNSSRNEITSENPFIYNQNITSLLSDNNLATVKYEWQIPTRNTTYYCAVWAVNDNNKFNSRSNIITVFVPEIPPTTTTVTTTTSTTGEPATSPVEVTNSDINTTATTIAGGTNSVINSTTNVTLTAVTSVPNNSTCRCIVETFPTASETTTSSMAGVLRPTGGGTSEVAEEKEKKQTGLYLTAGEIAGIVIGGLALLIVAQVLIIICFRWTKNRKKKCRTLFPHLSMTPTQNNRTDVIRGHNARTSIADSESNYGDLPRGRPGSATSESGPRLGIGNNLTENGNTIFDPNRFASIKSTPIYGRHRPWVENNFEESRLAKTSNQQPLRVPLPAKRRDLQNPKEIDDRHQLDDSDDDTPVNLVHQGSNNKLVPVEPPEVPLKSFSAMNDARDAVMEELYSKVDPDKKQKKGEQVRPRNQNITEV